MKAREFSWSHYGEATKPPVPCCLSWAANLLKGYRTSHESAASPIREANHFWRVAALTRINFVQAFFRRKRREDKMLTETQAEGSADRVGRRAQADKRREETLSGRAPLDPPREAAAGWAASRPLRGSSSLPSRNPEAAAPAGSVSVAACLARGCHWPEKMSKLTAVNDSQAASTQSNRTSCAP
jgi:hypothetical protein